jgi:GNAT superfamily N-acetyltransferase
MTPADLDTTNALADAVHVDHPESPEVQRDRLALFPDGCLVLATPGGTILGYCVAHSGVVGRPPALDTVLGQAPEGADCLYIHDICLLPEARGHGYLRPLMDRLVNAARAHGFPRMALTAVSGAETVWSHLGFTVLEGDETLKAKLATYEGPAFHMVRAVPSQ